MNPSRQLLRAEARKQAFHDVNAKYGLEPRRARRRIALRWACARWKQGILARAAAVGLAACGILAIAPGSAHAQGYSTVGGGGVQTTTANTWSATQTFTNLNNVLFASQFAGADPGAKVNAAIAACPVNGCHVVADFYGFSQNVFATITIPAGVWVHFMESRWECNTGANPCVVVNQGGHIVGSGVHLTSAQNGIGTDFNAHNMTAVAVIQFRQSGSAAFGNSIHWASGEQFGVHAYDNNTLTNGCIEVDNPGENFALRQVQLNNCNANSPTSGSGLYVFGLMAGSAVFEGITSNGNQYAFNFDGVTSLTHAFRFKGDGNKTFLRVAPRAAGGGATVAIYGLTWEAPGTGPPILIDTSTSQAFLNLTDVAGDCGAATDFIQVKAPLSMSVQGFQVGATCTNEVNDTFTGRVIANPGGSYNTQFWAYDINGKTIDIAGSLGFTSEASAAVNGANQNFKLGQFTGGASYVRITGPTAAFNIGGLATVFSGTGPFDGRIAILNNTTSQAMTLNNEDAGSTATNRITTPTGASVTLPTGSSQAMLIYSGSESRWRLLSTTPSPLAAQGFITTDVLDLRDDFTACTSNTNTMIGSLGWIVNDVVAGSTYNCPTNSFPNPGLLRVTTPAVATQGGGISINQNLFSPLGNLGGNTNWEAVWVFRLNSCANVRLRIGLDDAGAFGVVQPVNGMWLRFDTSAGFADTLFTFETRASSVSTTSTTNSVACNTNFNKIRIRSAVAGTILFSVNGGAETSLSTNVPTANMAPAIILVTDAAASKSADMDLFAFKAFALGR